MCNTQDHTRTYTHTRNAPIKLIPGIAISVTRGGNAAATGVVIVFGAAVIVEGTCVENACILMGALCVCVCVRVCECVCTLCVAIYVCMHILQIPAYIFGIYTCIYTRIHMLKYP